MNKKGFTLIELIVVISIIALLSVIGLASYQRVQRNARDAKRIGDMQELKKALLVYKSVHGTFPTDFDNDCQGWDAASANSDSASDSNFFIDGLAKTTIMETVPRDPLIDQTTDPCEGHNGEGRDYYYHRYTTLNPSWGCPSKVFIIIGTDMESSDGAHPDSIGWKECSGRTWYEAFDYVIGIYE